jgi:hypothetical protein
MDADVLLNRGAFFLMDFDLRSFLISHFIDIGIVVFFAVKVIFVSNANLRVKLTGVFLLLGVAYVGQIMKGQLLAPATPIFWSIAVWIGIRLLALKIIYMVIEWEQ